MASGQRRLVVLLLLLFLVVMSATAVPITRSLKEVKNQVSLAKFHTQDVKKMDKNDGLQKWERFIEGRTNLELADYPETGPNPKNSPPIP